MLNKNLTLYLFYLLLTFDVNDISLLTTRVNEQKFLKCPSEVINPPEKNKYFKTWTKITFPFQPVNIYLINYYKLFFFFFIFVAIIFFCFIKKEKKTNKQLKLLATVRFHLHIYLFDKFFSFLICLYER